MEFSNKKCSTTKGSFYEINKTGEGQFKVWINGTKLHKQYGGILDLKFVYNKEFFNYYKILAEDGLSLDTVRFSYDGSLWIFSRGYSCSENCFILETTEGSVNESPILDGPSSLKIKRYFGGEYIVLRFGPQYSKYVYGGKIADGLFLGIIAGIFVELFILFLKNNKKK